MPFLTQGPEGEQVPYGAGKTNWKFIGIVLVLAVILGGGIWWCVERQKNETAGWQTHKNQEYGFEIKYPSAFLEKGEFSCKIPVSGGEIVADDQAIRFYHTFYFEICFDPDCEDKIESDMDIGFEICRVEGEYKKIAEGFYDVWKGESREIPPHPIIIAGQNGMGMEGLIGKRAYQRANHYFLEKDENTAIVLRFYYHEMEFRPELKTAEENILFDQQKEIFNQMLSTFRFIETSKRAVEAEEEIKEETEKDESLEEKAEDPTEEEVIERHIKVLYPNGGEEFTAGESLIISWEAENVEKIDIILSEKRNDRAIYLPPQRYIARDFILTRENQYQWVIPEDLPSSKYALSISSGDGRSRTGDSSEDYFTISGTLSIQDKEVMLKQLIVGGEFDLSGNNILFSETSQAICQTETLYLYKIFKGPFTAPHNQEYIFVLGFVGHKYQSFFLGIFDKDKNLVSSPININKLHESTFYYEHFLNDIEAYFCQDINHIFVYGGGCPTGGWCSMRANLYRFENGEFQVFQNINKTVGDMKGISEGTDLFWFEREGLFDTLHLEIEKDKILVYEWGIVDEDFDCVAPDCIYMYEGGHGYKVIMEYFTTLFWDENECKFIEKAE